MIRVRGKACQRGRCVRRSGQNRERRPCRSAAESAHENAFGQIRRRIDQRFADSPEVVEEVGIAARRAGVGAPCRGYADSPKVGNIVAAAALVRSWAGRRTLQDKAPSPGPSPSGGGRRPQGRQERENVTGLQCGNERNWRVCERLYRLLAVTFSLFRHPPRGGSADATFPRWGKEGETRSGPVGGGGFLFVLSAKCSRVSQREHPCREAAHERHEEKDKCPYSEDTCPFLLTHRPRRQSCQTLPAA